MDSRERDGWPATLPEQVAARFTGKGQWSIRINDQWRVCFVWNDGQVFDAEIVDYH